MDKIIETNLSLDNNGKIQDHQSRIIEVDWDNYVDEIKDGLCIDRISIIGHLWGVSMPREVTIVNFKSDDFHLSCDFILWNGTMNKRLAYRIKE